MKLKVEKNFCAYCGKAGARTAIDEEGKIRLLVHARCLKILQKDPVARWKQAIGGALGGGGPK